jgi:hypothetical protein
MAQANAQLAISMHRRTCALRAVLPKK